jgi:hypothetical protein
MSVKLCCADRVAARVVRCFLLRRGQQRHETRLAAAIYSHMAQFQIFVPAKVEAIFRPRSLGDDLLDDGNLRYFGDVHILFVKKMLRSAGLLALHDCFGIDEREFGTIGEELP